MEVNVLCCPYCNHPMEGRGGRTRDHVIPVFHGGTDDRRNIVRVCKTCNGDKANWFLSEWVAILRRHNDPRTEHVERFAAVFAPVAAEFEAEHRAAVIEAAKLRKSRRPAVPHLNTADMAAAEERREQRRVKGLEKQARIQAEAAERKRKKKEKAASDQRALIVLREQLRKAMRDLSIMKDVAGIIANPKRSADIRYVPDYLVTEYQAKGWFVDDQAPAATNGAVLMRLPRHEKRADETRQTA